MHPNSSELIDKIVSLRRAKGISQRQLATYTGISYVVIARLESKKHPPTIDTLNKLLEALDAKLSIQEDQESKNK